MNPASILVTPWRATHRALRWLTLAIFVACCVGAIVVGFFVHKSHWWLFSTVMYCLGTGYLWAFLMSSLLLVSIDVRQLRLPGIARAAAWSLVCYGVLSVAAPVAVLVALGANALLVALLVALAITAGLAFALLPRYLAMLIGFLPALGSGLRHVVHIPSPTDPRFVAWGSCTLLVLLLVDVVRWRQLLRAESKNELGLSSAMVLRFRRQGAMGNWGGLAQQGSSQLIRQRPDWLQAQADLRKVGPQAPVLALRTALGGWYVPQTWFSYVRQAAPALLPILLWVPVMAIQRAGEAHGDVSRQIWMSVGIGVVGWLGVFGGVMLAAVTTIVLRHRWSRVNAELPLLALLPGLGDATAVRRHLLRAALVKPLLAQALLLLLTLGAALAMHFNGGVLAFVTLSQLGCAGVAVAFALGTFGGRNLPTWGGATLLIAACVMVSLSTFIPLTTTGRNPWRFGVDAEAMLVAGWIALAVALLWLGRRGWRGLQQRPHPFLAN